MTMRVLDEGWGDQWDQDWGRDGDPADMGRLTDPRSAETQVRSTMDGRSGLVRVAREGRAES